MEESSTSHNLIVASYRGNISSSQYDSIVNQLTMYRNETFDIHQVDRIAEHHLNERDHSGIYAYLADSTQLGLYTVDGQLMLRFIIKENGLLPVSLDGIQVIDSTILWKKQNANN